MNVIRNGNFFRPVNLKRGNSLKDSSGDSFAQISVILLITLNITWIFRYFDIFQWTVASRQNVCCTYKLFTNNDWRWKRAAVLQLLLSDGGCAYVCLFECVCVMCGLSFRSQSFASIRWQYAHPLCCVSNLYVQHTFCFEATVYSKTSKHSNDKKSVR